MFLIFCQKVIWPHMSNIIHRGEDMSYIYILTQKNNTDFFSLFCTEHAFLPCVLTWQKVLHLRQCDLMKKWQKAEKKNVMFTVWAYMFKCSFSDSHLNCYYIYRQTIAKNIKNLYSGNWYFMSGVWGKQKATLIERKTEKTDPETQIL